jgi:hypothetical protein
VATDREHHSRVGTRQASRDVGHRQLPLVWEPGPECFHPDRLCMVASTDVCRHALTPFLTKKSVHSLTRCARDLPKELSSSQIAEQLGITESRVNGILREIIAKLRKRARV